jgi:hypothetical protein
MPVTRMIQPEPRLPRQSDAGQSRSLYQPGSAAPACGRRRGTRAVVDRRIPGRWRSDSETRAAESAAPARRRVRLMMMHHHRMGLGASRQRRPADFDHQMSPARARRHAIIKSSCQWAHVHRAPGRRARDHGYLPSRRTVPDQAHCRGLVRCTGTACCHGCLRPSIQRTPPH